MINRDDIDNGATASDIAKMNLSDATLSHEAIMLLGYQRTKQISRRSRLAWQNGDADPLSAEAKERRREIFEGALLEIYQEYLPIKQQLDAHDIAPKTVIDIGCGQALNDLFLNQDFAPHFTLVDIERTPKQYHQFSNNGSGYASLVDAQALLNENGVPASKVVTINPTKDTESVATLQGDLVTSLYSCGFHYPVDEYVPLFDRVIADGGAICVDLRLNYIDRLADSANQLLNGRNVSVVYEDIKSKRVLVRA